MDFSSKKGVCPGHVEIDNFLSHVQLLSFYEAFCLAEKFSKIQFPSDVDKGKIAILSLYLSNFVSE